MSKPFDMDINALDAYLKASAVLTEIAHGTNLSIDGCDSPTKFTLSEESAPDFKLTVELNFDSNTPIKVSTDTASRECEKPLVAQEYILRLVTAHRIKTA